MKKYSKFTYVLCPKLIDRQDVENYTLHEISKLIPNCTLNEAKAYTHVKKDKLVDMIYKAFNFCLPDSDHDLKNIKVSEDTVNAYGLDRIVWNVQRHMKCQPHAIWVVKFPSRFIDEAMSDDFSYETYSSARSDNQKYLNSLYYVHKNEKNGYDTGYSGNYIDRVYLYYPDCRVIVNENWKSISDYANGLILSPEQLKIANIFYSNYSYLIDEDIKKQRLVIENSYTTEQLDEEFKYNYDTHNDYNYFMSRFEYETKMQTIDDKGNKGFLHPQMSKKDIDIKLEISNLDHGILDLYKGI